MTLNLKIEMLSAKHYDLIDDIVKISTNVVLKRFWTQPGPLLRRNSFHIQEKRSLPTSQTRCDARKSKNRLIWNWLYSYMLVGWYLNVRFSVDDYLTLNYVVSWCLIFFMIIVQWTFTKDVSKTFTSELLEYSKLKEYCLVWFLIIKSTMMGLWELELFCITITVSPS